MPFAAKAIAPSQKACTGAARDERPGKQDKHTRNQQESTHTTARLDILHRLDPVGQVIEKTEVAFGRNFVHIQVDISGGALMRRQHI